MRCHTCRSASRGYLVVRSLRHWARAKSHVGGDGMLCGKPRLADILVLWRCVWPAMSATEPAHHRRRRRMHRKVVLDYLCRAHIRMPSASEPRLYPATLTSITHSATHR